MKKNVKVIVALALAVIMTVASQEGFLAAATSNWTIDTNSAENEQAEIIIPYCKKNITYKLTDLSATPGTYSYLAAVCDTNGRDAALYWIGGEGGPIKFTKASKKVFQIEYSSYAEQSKPYVSFIIYIEHDATAASKASLNAEGLISYE